MPPSASSGLKRKHVQSPSPIGTDSGFTVKKVKRFELLKNLPCEVLQLIVQKLLPVEAILLHEGPSDSRYNSVIYSVTLESVNIVGRLKEFVVDPQYLPIIKKYYFDSDFFCLAANPFARFYLNHAYLKRFPKQFKKFVKSVIYSCCERERPCAFYTSGLDHDLTNFLRSLPRAPDLECGCDMYEPSRKIYLSSKLSIRPTLLVLDKFATNNLKSLILHMPYDESLAEQLGDLMFSKLSLYNLNSLEIFHLTDSLSSFEALIDANFRHITLPLLRDMRLSKCKVKHLTARKMPKLEKISLFKCNVDDKFSFQEVTEFVANKTKFLDLDAIADQRVLKVLSLAYANLRDMGRFVCLQNLVELKLPGNTIETIESVGELTCLQKLDLSENEIASINPIKELELLRILNLSHNRIKSFRSLRKLSNLKVLNLLKNSELSSMRDLKSLTNLRELSLSFCNISRIRGLENMRQLKILNLLSNRIEVLEGLTSQKDSLELLDVSGNLIGRSHVWFESFPNLVGLLLSRNYISDVKGFSNVPKLNLLDLCDNRIKFVNANLAGPALSFLMLMGNPIIFTGETKRNLGKFLSSVMSRQD